MQSPNNEIEEFSHNHYNSVRSLCELMGEPWFSVQLMPYQYFVETIKWKVDLEEQKKKMMDERNRDMEADYRNKMNIQKAQQRQMNRKR